MGWMIDELGMQMPTHTGDKMTLRYTRASQQDCQQDGQQNTRTTNETDVQEDVQEERGACKRNNNDYTHTLARPNASSRPKLEPTWEAYEVRLKFGTFRTTNIQNEYTNK